MSIQIPSLASRLQPKVRAVAMPALLITGAEKGGIIRTYLAAEEGMGVRRQAGSNMAARDRMAAKIAMETTGVEEEGLTMAAMIADKCRLKPVTVIRR